ncbi:ABC transporter substrate-binding protein [Edwardsiella piscicida]|nr:ABC transporter substrate-binding protein [Edwardsiella piscicida]AOP44692.1 ABC transporter substrate-binding protein [Edwardsiella piscicida]EKS7766948.1 oligopeptide ABC transporter substrate-binding protein OppA [Edwardsiella piscicida]EKS7780173.1 oligopeptide ABC transporter substrate-binding protein OppA [Edwardsiella piscicida]EKS7783913.1 oligopeptide ABC transporter substrate-binding protein OppA [Edwardsiella piscicida]UCQ26058.1 ABC transporter substrate-binding protein [Edwards
MEGNDMKIKYNLFFGFGVFMFSLGAPLAAEVPPGVSLAAAQTLTRNNGSEPASLDPHRSESDVEFNILRDFFEGLLTLDGEGHLRPGLAARWQHSEAGRVWTFSLRPDLRWSNGEALTAQDLVFSWRRLIDPATASPYATFLVNMGIKNAAAIQEGALPPSALGVAAPDARTLRVTLDQPLSTFLPMMVHPTLVPLNPRVLARYGDKWTQPGHFVGNGAYTLKQWVINERLVGERNPHYWDDAHTVIHQVVYLPIVSETAGVNRYRAGELDMTSLPSALFASLKQSLGEQVQIFPKLGTYYYHFNTRRAPFDDVRVRQALNLGLDKEIIAQKVLGQGQRPAWLFGSDDIGGMALRAPDYARWPRETRLARAKALLAEAGFGPGNPLRFTLLYNTSEGHQRIAIAAASMWKKNLGVEATLNNQEWKSMLDTMRSGHFDVVRNAWVADYDDPAAMLNTFRSGDSNNTPQYSNPRFDAVLAQASASQDPAARQRLFQQAEALLAEDVPTIPLYHYVSVRLVKPYVGGYQPGNMDYLYSKDMYIRAH